MSKICQVTGKRHAKGNNVSHANNKTRRSFKPNMHKKRCWSEELKRFITLLVSANGLRTIDKWGVDTFLARFKKTKPVQAD